MDESPLRTMEQIEQFLAASADVAFTACGGDAERYAHSRRVLLLMKEIKANIHRNRVAGVISALKGSSSWTSVGGEHNLTACMVKGSLVPLDESERRYSLDLHCADEHVDELVNTIRSAGRTGQANSGWIYVADSASAVAIT